MTAFHAMTNPKGAVAAADILKKYAETWMSGLPFENNGVTRRRHDVLPRQPLVPIKQTDGRKVLCALVGNSCVHLRDCCDSCAPRRRWAHGRDGGTSCPNTRRSFVREWAVRRFDPVRLLSPRLGAGVRRLLWPKGKRNFWRYVIRRYALHSGGVYDTRSNAATLIGSMLRLVLAQCRD